MVDPPVNVFIDDPTIEIENWQIQKDQWKKLNNEIGGNPGFYPLTIKAFYIFGVLLSIFRCVTILLEEGRLPSNTYIPAYSLFASGIDLLGRCIRGNNKSWDSSKDIKAGFQWLSKPYVDKFSNVPPESEIVETTNGNYKISQLVSLRNFSSHGQSTSNDELPVFDYFLLEQFPPLIARGMESYWSQLQSLAPPCNSLARANVLAFRNRPIFETLWSFSGREFGQQLPIGDIFSRLDWSYKRPKL